MTQANTQLILSSSRGRELERQLEHMEYLSRLQRAATQEATENHAYASTAATDLTTWNNGVLKMAEGLGYLDEDLQEFVRANNRSGLQVIGRLTQEGDIKLIEQVLQAPVTPKKYLVDEAAHVIRRLKSGS
jgi:hypothetical protein